MASNQYIGKIKRLTAVTNLLIVMSIIVFALSYVKDVLVNKWLETRDEGACLPINTDHNYATTYYLNSVHPVSNHAFITTFVEEYVHLVYDESVVDFHAEAYDVNSGTSNRYSAEAKLSKSKEKTLFLSKGVELAMNKLRYSASPERFNYLNSNPKKSILFLIDEIIVMPVIGASNIPVIVRGQFELMTDNSEDSENIAPEFLGYKEIRLTLQMSYPETSVDNEFVNQYGIHVIHSDMRSLDSGEKFKLGEKSRDYQKKGF